MIESGLSGMRTRKMMSADHPVASTIGTSGTSARPTLRSAASRTSATASSPPSRIASRRQGDAMRSFASAARTGSPASRAVTPGGGSSSRCIVFSTSYWRSSGSSLIPNASVAARRSGRDHVLREVRRDGVEQPLDARARRQRRLRREEVRERERRAEVRPPAALARVEPQLLEDPRLVARHPRRRPPGRSRGDPPRAR